MESDDAEEIQAKTDLLAAAGMKMGEAMNQAAGADQDPQPETESSKDDSKVVDGEFKDVSDNK